jgi:hypothetical protein
MRRVVTFLCGLSWLALVGLAGYEVVEKVSSSPLGPLPGHDLAQRADRQVRFRGATGLLALDRVLHEGEEACVYYRDLALGRRR